MTAQQITDLINIGAEQKVRQYFKKLSLKDRLPKLWELTPYVGDTPKTLYFFRENFAREIGALIMTKGDFEESEILYNQAKKN